MRIVLQHTTTNLYLKAPGVWTASVEEALNFGSSQRAIKFLRQEKLADVQVLVAFVERLFVDKVALQLPNVPQTSNCPCAENTRVILPPAA